MNRHELIAAQLRTYAEMLRRWQADPTCDAVECVIEGLEVQANRIEKPEDYAITTAGAERVVRRDPIVTVRNCSTCLQWCSTMDGLCVEHGCTTEPTHICDEWRRA